MPLSGVLRQYLPRGVVAGLLLAACGGLLAATPTSPSDDEPGRELARRAQALRERPTTASYRALAELADQFRESELSAQADFALGMADFEARRWTEARRRFRQARASPILEDHATLMLARTEAELGALEAAEQTLANFSFSESPVQEDVWLLRADLQMRAARSAEAADWLARLPETPKRPVLLLALGEAQRAAGRAADAVATLQRVYFEFPLTPQAEPANDLLAQLRAEMKERYPGPGESQWRSRAESLWSAGAYRGAQAAYTELAKSAGEPLRAVASLRLAIALYNLRSYDAACRELTKLGAPAGYEAELLSYRARCTLRGGKGAAAEADLAALEKQFPGTEWTQAALLAAGDAALTSGDQREAQDYYRRLVNANAEGRDAAEAHWKLTWLTYRRRDAASAELLEEHLTRFPDSPFRGRALYWRARRAVEAGQTALARHLFGLLREWSPRDYLAQQTVTMEASLRGEPAGDGGALPAWVKQMGSPDERASAEPLLPGARVWIEKAGVLGRLGFWELADRELADASERWPHPEISLARARMALEQKKYAVATEMLNRAYPGYWRASLGDLPRQAWETMFPRPYWELIEHEARRQGIDPFLVAALIRQESRFESQAVSSAGALGLMQLMPRTAEELAHQGRLSRARILEPALNVRLGARYLAQLLRRFNGNVEKALASYNGGGTRVTEWATTLGAEDTPEFVESIPVTQTREFVYIVLRNYRFYRDLYASTPLEAAAR